PIPGVNVQVDQTTHAFRFGTAVNNWRLFPQNPTADHVRYAETIEQYFNQGTLESGHKWTGWETRRQQAIDTVDWLRDRDMTVRGHVLLWPSWRRSPTHLRDFENQPNELRIRIAAHFDDILDTTRGLVTDWDVVNEPQTHFDILDVLGHDYVIEAFQTARLFDPAARLFLNEALNFNTVDKLRIFEQQALDWRSRGAPIDGLGIQAHYSGWSLTPPEKIWEELDRLAVHGFRLQITEFDIDTEDEDLQARYLRDFYTAVFAHPAVDTIQMWGFWEGSHWKPKAALWRNNWDIKPSGQAYIDLVENEWRTRTTLTTAANGMAFVRGFLGNYTLTLTHGGETRTVTLNLTRYTAPVEITW
ncbi:MAG: endo-1,4-beta-xylanase, partial [Verrucomicrobiota bacterium]